MWCANVGLLLGHQLPGMPHLGSALNHTRFVTHLRQRCSALHSHALDCVDWHDRRVAHELIRHVCIFIAS